MLLSSIQLLLSNQLSITKFHEDIKTEVNGYKSGLNKKGISNPIYLNEDIHYDLTETELNSFLNLISSGKLDEYQASYIAEALLLSNNIHFTNEDLMTSIEYLVLDNQSIS